MLKRISFLLILGFLLSSCLLIVAGEQTPPQAIFSFTMEPKDYEYEQYLTSETGTTIYLYINNTGTSPITVTIESDSEYITDNSKTTERIMIGGSELVEFTLLFNREIGLEEEIDVNFSAKIDGIPSSEQPLQIQIKSGKVLSAKIISFEASGTPKENEEITFTTIVENDGTEQVTVLVEIFDNDKKIEEISDHIDPMTSKPFVIMWEAQPGNYKFYAQISIIIGYENGDSNSPILQTLEKSDTKTMKIESAGIIPGFTTLHYILIFTGLILVLIIVYFIMKKKKVGPFKGKKRKK